MITFYFMNLLYNNMVEVKVSLLFKFLENKLNTGENATNTSLNYYSTLLLFKDTFFSLLL